MKAKKIPNRDYRTIYEGYYEGVGLKRVLIQTGTHSQLVNRTKYLPHQGKQECARRVRQRLAWKHGGAR